MQLSEESIMDILSLVIWEHGTPKIQNNEEEKHCIEINLEKYRNRTIKMEIYENTLDPNNTIIIIETSIIE